MSDYHQTAREIIREQFEGEVRDYLGAQDISRQELHAILRKRSQDEEDGLPITEQSQGIADIWNRYYGSQFGR